MNWETLAKQLDASARKLKAHSDEVTEGGGDNETARDAIFLEVYEARCSLARAAGLARVAALTAEKEARDEQ